MFANAHTHTKLPQRNFRKADGSYGPRCGPHALHYDINRVMLSRSQIKLNLFNLLTTKDFKITMRDDKGNEVPKTNIKTLAGRVQTIEKSGI